MKAFLLIFALFSFSAMGDCNREAQFIGSVRSVTYQPAVEGRIGFTRLQLSLGRWYAPSMVCPLWEDEFESAVIEIPGIPLIAEGDEISGVLVFDVATASYRID